MEYLKNHEGHDKYILRLLEKQGATENEKLECLDIYPEKLIEETEKLTGYDYKKKNDTTETQSKVTKHFAEISETDASDFFEAMAKQQEEGPEQKKEFHQVN